MNKRARQQYIDLLRCLCFKPKLSANDYLAVVYFMLLQV